MADIRVGTCGWTDPTLIRSSFYPTAARNARNRLGHYASLFRLVEVDSSYYAMPTVQTAGNWALWTPDDFVFDVKAFRLFTHHQTQANVLPPEIRALLPAELAASTFYQKDVPGPVMAEIWKTFEEALLPIDSAGKLGVVLFQFPPWFSPAKPNLAYLSSLNDYLPQYRLAVEFRSGAWLDERHAGETLSFLKSEGLSFVCVDEPQGFASSVPPVVEATSDIALVRFHGRNRQTWERRGISAAERFNYLYSEEELREWMPRIGRLAETVRQLHVLFNNCYGDKAVVNARQMASMLEDLPISGGAGRPAQE